LPLPPHKNLLLSYIFADFGRGKPLPYHMGKPTDKPKFEILSKKFQKTVRFSSHATTNG
jgi:hypothetical protein